MKGMEMMLNSLFKMVDLDPQEVIKQFKGAQELLVSSVTNFDNRLKTIEESQQQIIAKQNEILTFLKDKK